MRRTVGSGCSVTLALTTTTQVPTRLPPAQYPHKQLQQTPQNRVVYEVCSHSVAPTSTLQFTSPPPPPPDCHFRAQCASHHLTNKCYWPPKRLHCVLVLHVVSRCNPAPLQPCINIYIAAVAALYMGRHWNKKNVFFRALPE